QVGADVDHPAKTGLAHPGERGLHGIERAAHAALELDGEALPGDVPGLRARIAIEHEVHQCIVDHHRDRRAEMRPGRGEHGRHLCRIGDVGLYGQQLTFAELAPQRLRRRLAAAVIHHHPRTLPRERAADRGAQPAGPSGDEDDKRRESGCDSVQDGLLGWWEHAPSWRCRRSLDGAVAPRQATWVRPRPGTGAGERALGSPGMSRRIATTVPCRIPPTPADVQPDPCRCGKQSPRHPLQQETIMVARNTICLWFERDALDATRFYASVFPDSSVGRIFHAPSDFPSGKAGDILTVEFTVLGIPCVGLNGGPIFKQSEAFSFQVATADQAETDRYWNAIVGNGGKESDCGWCKDRWGVSWQITPKVLIEAINSPDAGVARRAFEAMMTMRKIDVAAIEAAIAG